MMTVPLFTQKKEIFFALLAVLVLSFFSLLIEYRNYHSLIQEPYQISEARVLNHYQKSNAKGRVYDVFKLSLPTHATFYTVSWKPIKVSVNEKVKVKFKVENLTFWEYLKGFYATSFYLYTLYQDEVPLSLTLASKIANQHSDTDMSSLYQALFLATPLSKQMRDAVQQWGIAHLVAISGFHLGVLSFLLYAMLNPMYRFFQNRYFPYRNAMADVGIIVLSVLYMYMDLIGFTPSFMRAFVMSVIGFFLFSRSVKILSFTNLLITTVVLLALFPSLIVSVSFWFSISGVFYIFLFLHHFSHLSKWKIFLALNVWVYVLMIPIVHFIFPLVSPLQLLSPILSMLFILFYPLAILLHVSGFGGILDETLHGMLYMQAPAYRLEIALPFLVSYVLASLVAIRYRWLCWVCFGFVVTALFFISNLPSLD